MIICCDLEYERFQENAFTPKVSNKPRQEAAALPCSNLFICWIWSTVFFRILHLSGLTLRVSMSPMFADSSSASSSKYLFSCSRRRFSLLLKKEKIKSHVNDFFPLLSLVTPGHWTSLEWWPRYNPHISKILGSSSRSLPIFMHIIKIYAKEDTQG